MVGGATTGFRIFRSPSFARIRALREIRGKNRKLIAADFADGRGYSDLPSRGNFPPALRKSAVAKTRIKIGGLKPANVRRHRALDFGE